MKIPFAQIDAFASRPFEGNPAAVMPLHAWLDDDVLQRIAEENNLSETAFIVPGEQGAGDWELRWFTPAAEVALCGHATLASGHYLLSADPSLDRVSFRTRRAGQLELVIVELDVKDADKAGSDVVKTLARDIAMQVAASSPMYLRREEADQKTLENEKHIAREKGKAEGKPEKILEKIAEGAANKFLAENVLLEQAFVKDDKLTVQKHVEKVAKELGTTIAVKAMHRFKVGEGIEKKADDFAAEVAKMAGTA